MHKLREYRREKFLSQQDLANMAGVDASYISKVELGYRSVDFWKAIGDVLRVNWWRLMEEG